MVAIVALVPRSCASAPKGSRSHAFAGLRVHVNAVFCRCDVRHVPCIPTWYRLGMSTQIAIRLSDDMVAFIDDLVRSGDARSRAAVVSRALERERRRKVAERDAAILSRQEPDPDLDGLAEFAAAIPLEDLD